MCSHSHEMISPHPIGAMMLAALLLANAAARAGQPGKVPAGARNGPLLILEYPVD